MSGDLYGQGSKGVFSGQVGRSKSRSGFKVIFVHWVYGSFSAGSRTVSASGPGAGSPFRIRVIAKKVGRCNSYWF